MLQQLQNYLVSDQYGDVIVYTITGILFIVYAIGEHYLNQKYFGNKK